MKRRGGFRYTTVIMKKYSILLSISLIIPFLLFFPFQVQAQCNPNYASCPCDPAAPSCSFGSVCDPATSSCRFVCDPTIASCPPGTIPPPTSQVTGSCPLNPPFNGLCAISPWGFVSAIITLLFTAAGIIAFLYLLWGGFEWITSSGEKEAVKLAREKITGAVIGLVIVLFSFAIIKVVGQFFGLNLLQITIPSIR